MSMRMRHAGIEVDGGRDRGTVLVSTMEDGEDEDERVSSSSSSSRHTAHRKLP